MIFIYLFVLPLIFQGIFLYLNIPLDNPQNIIIINTLIYLSMVIILLIIYRKSIFKEFKNYLKNWKKYFVIAFTTWIKAFLFMIISNSIIISLLQTIAQNEQANRQIITSFPIFSVLSMAILGPFLEEVLFRKSFKESFQKEKHFLIFTSLLFGIGHILISLDFSSIDAFINALPELLFIIPYGGMGYFLAKCYYETDNIFTSTTAHIIHNSLAVCISLLGV